jgi:tetratricopeptide (TPR) repeat protein
MSDCDSGNPSSAGENKAMSVLQDSDARLENVRFFYQASEKAIAYRLSFAHKERQNYRLLEREMPNLWEAIRQSYQHQAWEQVTAFRDVLQPFLDLRGYWAQSLTLNEWACEAAQALGDAVNAVRWTHDRADILHQRGDYREADRLYQACEEAYRALGENALALKSRHKRSLVVRAQGRIAEAEHLCRTTISEARELGLDHWVAHPLYMLALLIRDQGDLRRAEQCIAESLRLVDPNDIELIAHDYHFLGELAFLRGDLAQARAHLEKSLQLSQQIGIMRRIAATQRLLGDVARAEGRYEEAEHIYDEALGIVTHLGDRPVLARLLLSKASLLIRRKQPQDATMLLRGAISIYKEIGDARSVGGVSLLLLWQYLRQGHWLQALRVGFEGFSVVLSSGLLLRVLFNLRRFRTWWSLLTSPL